MTNNPLLETLQLSLGAQFAIERELGGGGMARVFVAEERALGRRIVLKVLPPDAAGGISAERFKREVQLAAKLNHPHIVPLLSAGEAAGVLYYTMPFIEGESLRARIAREHELPIQVAVRILREVADALAYAHAHDVVHRDIKPDNVLLAGEHAVVADFGIAKALVSARLTQSDETHPDTLTQVGVALGTPAYMSPEQASADPHVDHRADIYAVGALGYELLTGRPPFTGHSPQALLAAVISAAPATVMSLRPSVPESLDRLIMRCLEKRPADRPQSAQEVLRELDSYSTPVSLSAAGALPASRRRAWAAAAGIAAVVALGAAGVLSMRRSPMAPDAAAIAVMPFVPVSADSALSRLGRDLVVMISTNLDGVGTIRAIDPLTVLGLTSDGNQAGSISDAAVLAGKLGSKSFLYGTSMRDGQRVRVDFGLYSTSSQEPLARGSVTAAQDSISVLSDSLTWSVLRQIWRRDQPPAPSVAAISTKSMVALRAYLEGENARAEGRYMDAIAAFDRAIEADSTFWLAYWRNASTRDWMFMPADTVLFRYRAHEAELPERDRALLAAGEVKGVRAQVAAYRRVGERFPDYWLAWHHAGDVTFHQGPIAGIPLDEARADLSRVVALNPRWTEAWQHLLAIAITSDGIASTAADSIIRVLYGLGYDSASAQQFGVRELLLWRFVRAAILDTSVVSGPLGDSVVTALSNLRGAPIMVALLPLFPSMAAGGEKAQIGLSARMLAQGARGEHRSAYRSSIELAQASRGQFALALSLVERRAADSPEQEATLDVLRMASVAEWSGAVPGAFESRWTAAASDLARMPRRDQAEAVWLRGVLASIRRDTIGFAAASLALQRLAADTAARFARDHSRLLDAFQLDMQGQRAAAADSLTALAWEMAEDEERAGFSLAFSRITAGRWMQALGKNAEAARLLRWHEGGVPDRGFFLAKLMTQPLVLLERGRIAEAQGESADALRFYGQFLQRFDRPMPVHQPLVNEARAAVERLSRKSG